jgi:uncharacterized membrane protein
MRQTPIIAHEPLKGIALKVASVVVFTGMATCIKAASSEVPPGEAVFFRSFFAIPVILVWLMWTHDLKDGLKTTNIKGHMWRAVLGTAAMLLGFTSLAYLPLPEATAIGFAAPIITVILAALFLGEKIRIYRLAAVLTDWRPDHPVAAPVTGTDNDARHNRRIGSFGVCHPQSVRTHLYTQTGGQRKYRDNRVLLFFDCRVFRSLYDPVWLDNTAAQRDRLSDPVGAFWRICPRRRNRPVRLYRHDPIPDRGLFSV